MNTKASIKALQFFVTNLSDNAFEHKLQSRIFAYEGYTKLAEQYANHSAEEYGWVEQFATRLLDLGGDLKLEDRKASKLYRDPVEYVKAELDTQIPGLELVAKCMKEVADDVTTYDLLKAYYKDEEEDLYWMQRNLEQIKRIGDKNWLQSQL